MEILPKGTSTLASSQVEERALKMPLLSAGVEAHILLRNSAAKTYYVIVLLRLQYGYGGRAGGMVNPLAVIDSFTVFPNIRGSAHRNKK
jgi:hypothetical protein